MTRVGRAQSNIPSQREESVDSTIKEPQVEAHQKYIKQGYVWVQNWLANWILRKHTGNIEASIWMHLVPMQIEEEIDRDNF